MTRREFTQAIGAVFGGFALQGACRQTDASLSAQGRLAARPAAPRAGLKAPEAGTHPLGLATPRDALLQMPATGSQPLPLLVLLHGAGGSGAGVLRRLGDAPARAGVAVLAPDSRGSTWDAVRSGFGPDVAFLDAALARVFDMIPIDPARLAIGGFSDGASYAVSLGLINGDLFPRVVAFSPGFVVDGPRHGTPKFFVSHGTSDQILPIGNASRAIVPALQKAGYDVTYREFNGGHEVPEAIAREGMEWLTSGRKGTSVMHRTHWHDAFPG